MEENRSSHVERFLLEDVDDIPQLEALLLLWRNAPAGCTAAQVAQQLYISPEQADDVLSHWSARDFVLLSDDGQFSFNTSSSTNNDLLIELERMYRRELIRITHLIHSKASPGVRAFARAFRLRK